MVEFRRLYCAHAELHALFPFDGLLILLIILLLYLLFLFDLQLESTTPGISNNY